MRITSSRIKQAAKIIGSLGGKKGGAARASALSPERRKEISAMGNAVRSANAARRKAEKEKAE